MRRITWRAGAFAGAMSLAMFAAPAYAASGGEQALVAAAASLGAGQFSWSEADSAAGPVNIVVSIPLQKLFVYRGAALVAVSAVSTGSAGHETPTGEFTILQKEVDHHSNKYDNAAMPYMERLTWDGVAIHAGRDPGFPASHGCVRVPLAFAKKLYGITKLGAHVSVTDDAAVPGVPGLAAPSPVDAVMASVVADPEVQATREANLAGQ